MIVKSNKYIDKVEWRQLENNSPYTSFFQTKECYDFYCTLSFLEPFVYAVESGGKLKGLICGYIIANGRAIKRHFSRRAIIHGGALLSNDISNTELSLLLKTVRTKLSKKTIYVEIRNNHDYSQYKEVFEQSGFCYKAHYNYIVQTNRGIEAINRNLSKSKRRQVRKAKINGAKFVEATTKKEIRDFYTILSSLYKEKVKKPLFPIEFFEKIVTLSFGRLFVVKFKGEIIGGMLCAFMTNKTVYEWFVCGDDEKHKELYPSVFITYSVLEYATPNGFSNFDFMGAGTPSKHYGVRDFKGKFGGELVEWGRFLCVNKPFLHSLGEYSLRIKSKF